MPGEAPANANGTMPLGRYDAEGKFIPYFDRGEIDDGDPDADFDSGSASR